MNKLSEESGFEDDVVTTGAGAGGPTTLNVYRLRKCGHKLHSACLNMYIKNSSQVRERERGGLVAHT